MKHDLGSGYGDQGKQRAWDGIRAVQNRLVALAVHLRKNYPGTLDDVVARIEDTWRKAVVVEQELSTIEQLAAFDGTLGKAGVQHFMDSISAAEDMPQDSTFGRKVAEGVAR